VRSRAGWFVRPATFNPNYRTEQYRNEDLKRYVQLIDYGRLRPGEH